MSALQIYVHTDPDHPEQVVETYTFAIKYHDNGHGGRVFAGLEVDSPGREGITIEATSIALQSLIRHVNQLCEGLPDLPGKMRSYRQIPLLNRLQRNDMCRWLYFIPRTVKM